MARRSLRPHLNQIRDLGPPGPHRRLGRPPARGHRAADRGLQARERPRPTNGDAGRRDFDEEIDLRAEDDALIAAELEAAEAGGRARRPTRAPSEDEAGDEEEPKRRRRGRRGGRGRGSGAAASPLEGTFDHGEEGYGLWLDPAVEDDPIYAEHWAGHRPVAVTVEEDQIVIRRVGDRRRGPDRGLAAPAARLLRGGGRRRSRRPRAGSG